MSDGRQQRSDDTRAKLKDTQRENRQAKDALRTAEKDTNQPATHEQRRQFQRELEHRKEAGDPPATFKEASEIAKEVIRGVRKGSG